MTPAWDRSAGLPWHAVLVAATILACMLMVDPWFALWVRAWPEGLVWGFREFTDLGRSHWYLVPTGVGMLLFVALASRARAPRERSALASLGLTCGFVFVAVASTGLLTTMLKHLIGRARPKLIEQEGALGFAPLSLDADFASLPSGHANTVVALAVCLVFLWPRLWVPLAAGAAVLAFSRVAVGAHYPSDVIAGGYLAIVTTFAWRRVFAAQRLVFMPTPGGAIVVRGWQIRRWMWDRSRVRLAPVLARRHGWLKWAGGRFRDDPSR